MKNDSCCTKYKDKDICKDKWQKGNWRNDETYQAALAVSLSGKDHYHQAGQGHLGEDIDEDCHDGGGDDNDNDDNDDYDYFFSTITIKGDQISQVDLENGYWCLPISRYQDQSRSPGLGPI